MNSYSHALTTVISWRVVGWLLVGFAIGFIIATIINFENQLNNQFSKVFPRDLNKLPYGVFDDSLISALKKISDLVPENETVVVSDHAPVFKYLTSRHTNLPRGADSEETLFNFMKKNDYRYLVVYEG